MYEQAEYLISPNKDHPIATRMWEDPEDNSIAVFPDYH